MVEHTLTIAYWIVYLVNIICRVKKEEISEIGELPSQSLRIISATGYAVAQDKREKKANRRFICLPWKPKGRSKCKRTRTSQIFGRAAQGESTPVLTTDLLAPNSETDAALFDAWYHKHLSAYKV